MCDENLYRYARSMFGFLSDDYHVDDGTLAELVKKNYSLDSPINKAVYDCLKSRAHPVMDVGDYVTQEMEAKDDQGQVS